MKITPIGIWGAYPKVNEATSSFLIEQDGFRCLIDCGSGVLASLQNFTSLGELNAVVISHYHADHIADIGSLQYARMIGRQIEGDERILPIYGHQEDPEEFGKLTFKDVTEGKAIKETENVQIGPWTVSFCRTIHPVYCLALKFSSGGRQAVFTADTGWREELIQFAKGADLLVAEANLYERYVGQVEGHLSGRQAGELAEKAGVQTLLLTHLPQYGNLGDILTDAQQAFSGTAEIAGIGKTYTV